MVAGVVPAPFATNRVSGYHYGAPEPPTGWNGNGLSYGWTKHLGTDYGTTAGQPIVAPYGGTAKFESGLFGYGNRIVLTLEDGTKWIFGHVAAGVNGQVQQGQIIGTTGHDVGSSRGSVTLLEIINKAGQHLNPEPILSAIFGQGGLAAYRAAAASGGRYGMAQGYVAPTGGPGASGLAGAASGSASQGPDIGAALATLEADLAAAPAEAAKNTQAQVQSLNQLPQGVAKAIQGILPTTAHVYRAFFVGVGILMILGGVLIYFRGDELVAQAQALPGEAAKAGEVAAVAA